VELFELQPMLHSVFSVVNVQLDEFLSALPIVGRTMRWSYVAGCQLRQELMTASTE